MPRASIIIPTYNQLRPLELVFAALDRQTVTDFEVVVGDDGSTEETRSFLTGYRSRTGFPVRHVRQPDQGRRVGEARNAAIGASEGDWLIFLDGDMIVHPRFVESHLSLARPGRVLFGGRVKLAQSFSENLTAESLRSPGIETLYRKNYAVCREATYAPVTEGPGDRFGGWLVQRFGGDYRPGWNRWLNHLSQLTGRSLFQKICFKSGCNFSTSRAMVEAANGFDLRFNGLSGEDGEFFCRLYNGGAEPRSVLFSAIAYHLWHEENWERTGERREKAKAMESETRRTRKTRCRDGLAKNSVT